MMTCVSERSGSASSGVARVAWIPPEASISVHLIRKWSRGRRDQQRSCAVSSRFARPGKRVKRAAEVRFRVNEELPRRDDSLPWRKTLQDLRAATILGADPHDRRAKVSAVIGEDHEVP